MQKYTILFISLLMLVGCIKITPKLKADLKAEVKTELYAEFKAEIDTTIKAEMNNTFEAKMENTVNSKVEAAAVKVETNMNAKFGDLKSSVDQTVGTFKGNQNVGAFSGDGFYVTVIAIGVIILMGILLWHKDRKASGWKQVLEAMGTAINDMDNNGGSEHSAAVKKFFKKHLTQRGLRKMVDKFLKDRELYKGNGD